MSKQQKRLQCSAVAAACTYFCVLASAAQLVDRHSGTLTTHRQQVALDGRLQGRVRPARRPPSTGRVWPVIDVAVTMEGLLVLRRRCGTAARQHRTTPSRLSSNMRAQTSSSVSTKLPCGVSPPATLIKTSGPPSRAAASATPEPADEKSVASLPIATCAPLIPSKASTASPAASRSRSQPLCARPPQPTWRPSPANAMSPAGDQSPRTGETWPSSSGHLSTSHIQGPPRVSARTQFCQWRPRMSLSPVRSSAPRWARQLGHD